jgi:hypothetical protein
MQTRSTFLYFSAFVFAATIGIPRASAEPNALYAIQLRRGFEACDQKDADRYFSQRDHAFKGDASLRSYKGKIEKYDVAQTLARCDGEMAAKREADAKTSKLAELYQAVDRTCIRSPRDESVAGDLAEYRAARGAFVAANGGSTALLFPPEAGVAHHLRDAGALIAQCDARAVKAVEDQKRRAELAKQESEKQARAAAEAAARAKANEEHRKAVLGALRGDRASVVRERGTPDIPGIDELARASTWTYQIHVPLTSTDVGRGSVQTSTWCDVSVSFKGDKKVAAKRVGPGCKFVE